MFFKKKKKGDELDKLTVKVDAVYVASCTVKASVSEGKGKGFYNDKATVFYLVTNSPYGYKELFTGRDVYMDEDEEFYSVSYIQKVEPLREYLADKAQEEITHTALFDIIATINVMAKLENSKQIKKGRKKQ